MARSLIPRRNISVHRSNSSAPSRSLRPLRGIFYGRKISISQCHVVRLPQIIGTHSMQTVQWWPTVAYVTITLHAIRTCEYCPPQHLCHLSCAVHEMCNTKLKQTLLSSVHIDPYTKQAVFPVIVHSYTRRLAAFIPGKSVVEPSEKKRQEKKYAGGLVRLCALYSSLIFSSYFLALFTDKLNVWNRLVDLGNMP